jgi:hypothetical protein
VVGFVSTREGRSLSTSGTGSASSTRWSSSPSSPRHIGGGRRRALGTVRVLTAGHEERVLAQRHRQSRQHHLERLRLTPDLVIESRGCR